MQNRPSLIILDDIESEDSVNSDDLRHSLHTWFSRTVLNAGDENTNIIVIGTILHYDSLLSKLFNRSEYPNWTAKKYQAVIKYSSNRKLWQKWERIYKSEIPYKKENGKKAARAFFESKQIKMLKGAKVLWKEKEDYYELMELKHSARGYSFDAEKQNEPVNSEDCLFPIESLHFWDDQFKSEEELLNYLDNHCGGFDMYGACDPSLGLRHGDYAGIVSIAVDQDSRNIFVLDAFIKRLKPDELVEQLVSFCQLRRYDEFYVEANTFQKLLVDNFQKRVDEMRLRVWIKEVTNTKNKQARISGLQPLISGGKILFSRKHSALIDQLRQFPFAAHDDGIDALEIAVREAPEYIKPWVYVIR